MVGGVYKGFFEYKTYFYVRSSLYLFLGIAFCVGPVARSVAIWHYLETSYQTTLVQIICCGRIFLWAQVWKYPSGRVAYIPATLSPCAGVCVWKSSTIHPLGAHSYSPGCMQVFGYSLCTAYMFVQLACTCIYKMCILWKRSHHRTRKSVPRLSNISRQQFCYRFCALYLSPKMYTMVFTGRAKSRGQNKI